MILYLQKVVSKKTTGYFLLASKGPLRKKAGSGPRSGSVSQLYGSPDPYQNVTDLQNWKQRKQTKTRETDKNKNGNEGNKQRGWKQENNQEREWNRVKNKIQKWKSKPERTLNLKQDDKLQYVATVHSHSS